MTERIKDAEEMCLTEWMEKYGHEVSMDNHTALKMVEKTIQVKGAGSDLHEWAKRIEVTDDLDAVLILLDQMIGFARHAENLLRYTKCMVLLEYAVHKARVRLDAIKDATDEEPPR